jgi:hypothetical protein
VRPYSGELEALFFKFKKKKHARDELREEFENLKKEKQKLKDEHEVGLYKLSPVDPESEKRRSTRAPGGRSRTTTSSDTTQSADAILDTSLTSQACISTLHEPVKLSPGLKICFHKCNLYRYTEGLRDHVSQKVIKHMQDAGIDTEFIKPHHMDIDTLLAAATKVGEG